MTSLSESSQVSESTICFEIPPFAEACRQAASVEWQASFDHPLLKALIDGTLEESRFRYYQMQDARYLEAYADACSLISVRFSDPDKKLWFIEGARLAIVVERELHKEYGRKLGYSAQDIALLELSPNNRAYQNHLISMCQKSSQLEAVSTLSPCPWLYADIGKQFAHVLATIPDDHPYRDWLATYADPSFVTYTNELLGHLQFLADQVASKEVLQNAVDAFVLSARYEVMFWEQAWQLQNWTI